jgi:hypothetical protein
MSAPSGPHLSWKAFAAVMVPFLVVFGVLMGLLR